MQAIACINPTSKSCCASRLADRSQCGDDDGVGGCRDRNPQARRGCCLPRCPQWPHARPVGIVCRWMRWGTIIGSGRNRRGMIDLGFKERWLVVDVLLKRERPDLGDHSIQFCDPERPMTYCRSPKNRRRWEISLKDDEADDQVTREERIWSFLSDWIGPQDADLERCAVYTFESKIARSWRKGRMMIAGDAAHLTPPFMGQGMCAGIRDSANLAWKLALCVKGLAKPGILDSYQEERAPHARIYIETAMRLGGLVNALEPESALAMASQDETGIASMASISPTLGPSDLGGMIAMDTPCRGHLFPQPTLRDGRMLDDSIGFRAGIDRPKPAARRGCCDRCRLRRREQSRPRRCSRPFRGRCGSVAAGSIHRSHCERSGGTCRTRCHEGSVSKGCPASCRLGGRVSGVCRSQGRRSRRSFQVENGTAEE